MRLQRGDIVPRKIKQPKSKKISAVIKQQKIQVNLAWKQTFGKDQTARFDNAQKFVDSECIRLMVKYTPARNNILYKTATLGTKIGSGHIYYNSPYARYLYYGEIYGPNFPIYEQGKLVSFYSPPQKHPTGRKMQYDKERHPQAQKLWFEVMKTNHKEQILRGAAAIAAKKGR